MKELTNEMINEVSGGFGPPGAAFGGFVGAAGYLGSAATSGSFSWSGLGTATLTGAVTGFIGGPVTSTFARYAIPRL